MARIINGTLYVTSYDPTGNPGEYTFTDALFENQADADSAGATAVQVGFILFIQALDPYSFFPVPGVAHRYRITSIQAQSYLNLSATILWDEEGSEIDAPQSGSYAIISENTPNLGLGLPSSPEVYSNLPGGIGEAAQNVDSKNTVDTLSSGPLYDGTAERTVGGITEGMIFTNSTMQTMWDQLIKQEKFPALTAPSSTFTSSVTGYQEVGLITSINFNAAFNRGSISPQYTATSPYRSGLPNAYNYTGTGLSSHSSTSLTDSTTVIGYTVILGAQSWQGQVAYDAGVQPKSSYDNTYSTPLPAGTTSFITNTITGVYPTFATTVSITVMTQQSLAAMNSTYLQTNMVAESEPNKQTADFPTGWTAITGIQFYNTVSSQWEWINGSKANSLTTFTTSSTTYPIHGNTINYTRYTQNGATIGARQLRWYTT